MKEYLKPEIAFLSFETEAITMGGDTDISQIVTPGSGGI